MYRQRRVRITPLGYIVLSIIILIMLVGIYFIIWSMRGNTGGEQQQMASNSIEITPTPSLPPINEQGNSAAAATQLTPEPTTAPTDTPTMPPETPTTTPKLDDTPEPAVKTPSPSQVSAALDGKTTSKLNLRQGPGKQYSVIATYSTGTRLKVYAKEDDFYFVMVIKENKYGYMSAEFVEKTGLLPGESATPTPPAPTGAINGTVRASTLALRSAPTTESKAVGQATGGDAVYIYFKTGDFYYIQIVSSGLKCYGYAEYINADTAVPSGTPMPE